MKAKLEVRIDRIEAGLRDLPDRILARLPQSESLPPGLELDRPWTPVLSGVQPEAPNIEDVEEVDSKKADVSML